jgi:hypothetical protein
MADKLGSSLAENLITVLCHDDVNGKIVAAMVEPELFEGDYREIAQRAQEYWHVHGEAPKVHTPDLISDILEDPKNKKAPTFRRILTSMLELSEELNTTYVLDQLHKFTRLQHLKSAVLQSAETLSRSQDLGIAEVEEIWQDLLKERQVAFEPGLRITDYERVLAYMQSRDREFDTGIPELDDRYIVPARGSLMLLLGATGTGKSWGLIHLGKRALAQRKKVVHLTFELSEEQTLQRYYQSLFSIRKRGDAPVSVTQLDVDSLGHLTGFDEEEIEPEFSLTNEMAPLELENHIARAGHKIDNLFVRRFPPGHLTTNALRSFLDTLEQVEKFVPDLLIIDMIPNLKTDAKNHRISLGANTLDVRALLIERNIAGASAMQANRSGAMRTHLRLTDIGEDWSAAQTADVVLVMSRTDAERRHGLARLYVGKAREEEDRFGLLITQNYAIGQFALESIPLRNKYWDLLAELKDKDAEYDSEEDDSGEE